MAGARNQVADWLNRVVQLHDRIIDRYGGAPGILDASLLKAAIERPWTGLADGTENYPGVFVKAAVLLERIINYHPFVDGNKRTATILVFEFLRRHGCVAVVESSEIVDVAVRIAEKDYRKYREELTFDELCASLGDLFKQFLSWYRDGSEDKIFKLLKSAGGGSIDDK